MQITASPFFSDIKPTLNRSHIFMDVRIAKSKSRTMNTADLNLHISIDRCVNQG